MARVSVLGRWLCAHRQVRSRAIGIEFTCGSHFRSLQARAALMAPQIGRGPSQHGVWRLIFALVIVLPKLGLVPSA